MWNNTLTRALPVGLAALLLVLGCGKDDENRQPQADNTIRDIQVIANTADRRELVGRKVDIADAEVQQVVGNYVFWAGNPHTAVPVAREDKMKGPVTDHVRTGGHVAMTGTIRLLETVPAADKLWDRITPAERADLMAAKVYIAADPVRIIR